MPLRLRRPALAAPALLAWGLAGCGLGLTPVPENHLAPADTDSGSATEDTGSRDTGSRDTGGHDSGKDSGDTGKDTGSGGPREPVKGDLVISELMIDPAAEPDSQGEWVEIANVSDHVLDLTDLQLTDDDVDLVTISGSARLAAGEYAVLCADANGGENGGVSCTASYTYGATGGDFALANTGDEVNLLAADGTVLDSFRYGDGFAGAGVSMGVAPAQLTPAGNDAAAAWCPQRGALSGGDVGTPGARNTGC